MKVLLVHNWYGSSAPSGENAVVKAEAELLRSNGIDVAEYFRYSDDIRGMGWLGKIIGGISTSFNPFSYFRIRHILRRERPDVVHVHNFFPLISPAIFHAIGHRAARVLTLHNYRLFCPAAIPMRSGHVCTECLDSRSVRPALRYGCYRNSRLATLPLALNVALHRTIGTWNRQVDAFIALTEFQRERMVDAGLPTDRVHVKPNFYPGDPKQVPWRKREDVVVFAGRLTPEKGVETLVRAWLAWGNQAPELRILGEGPLRGLLERLALSVPVARIRFLGQLSSSEAEWEIAQAKLLVLPSVWFEGFPMVLLEAFAGGTPAAVSGIGSLPFIVNQGVNGVVFSPGDAQSLLKEVQEAWRRPGELERLSEGARAAFESAYTEQINYQNLMEIYDVATYENKRYSKE